MTRDQEDVAARYKHLTFAGIKLITLAEGEIIGLGYNWMDYDEVGREVQGGGWQAFYNLSQHDRMYRSGDGACDFFLAPVDESVEFSAIPSAVEATTWGRVKAGFVQ